MNLQSLKYGAYAGLVGGVVFGIMMGMMGMLPMIGQMVGSSSSLVGFLVHMVNSAIIGPPSPWCAVAWWQAWEAVWATDSGMA